MVIRHHVLLSQTQVFLHCHPSQSQQGVTTWPRWHIAQLERDLFDPWPM